MGSLAPATLAFGLAAALLFSAWQASGRRIMAKLPLLIGSASIAFGLLLVLLNSWLPFAGGGDDEDYFASSQRVLVRTREWFDLGQFRQEQGGYPLVLTWTSQVVGSSLFGLKLVNLFAFLTSRIRSIGGKLIWLFTLPMGVALYVRDKWRLRAEAHHRA